MVNSKLSNLLWILGFRVEIKVLHFLLMAQLKNGSRKKIYPGLLFTIKSSKLSTWRVRDHFCIAETEIESRSKR